MLGLTDPTIFYENLKQRLAERIPAYGDCIEQLGLLDETPVVKLNTPLDTLSNYLSKRLAFGKLCTRKLHIEASLLLLSYSSLEISNKI